LTAFDAALIARYVIGDADPSMPIGGWRFDPPSQTLAPTQPAQPFDFRAHLVGDVTGNWGHSMNSHLGDAAPDKLTIQAALPHKLVMPGTTARLPLTVSATGVQAFSAELRIDPTKGASLTIAAAMPDWTLVSHNPEPGLFLMAGYGVTPLDAGEPLAWITVTLHDGKLGDSVSLTLDALQIDESTALVETHSGSVSIGTSFLVPHLQGP
jgi:hypothetical protein